jgi:LacI family transcriptional regulator, repressor for deo operon, udp, cdd, tsx, nupC, and nupG
MAALRFTGYKQAIEGTGAAVDPSLVVQTGSYHRGDGESAMAMLLDSDRLPDGVFCATDLLALGAMKAIHERGLRMPDDIAVVGFDGLEEGRYAVPPLSTIEPDKGEIARVSVETLLTRIREREAGAGSSELRDVDVPFSLIVRESSV